MVNEPQTDRQAANSAMPDTETLPRWDDPDWESYLDAVTPWYGNDDDDYGDDICEDCGELYEDCICDDES